MRIPLLSIQIAWLLVGLGVSVSCAAPGGTEENTVAATVAQR